VSSFISVFSTVNTQLKLYLIMQWLYTFKAPLYSGSTPSKPPYTVALHHENSLIQWLYTFKTLLYRGSTPSFSSCLDQIWHFWLKKEVIFQLKTIISFLSQLKKSCLDLFQHFLENMLRFFLFFLISIINMCLKKYPGLNRSGGKESTNMIHC
jgi:hypothetical protein